MAIRAGNFDLDRTRQAASRLTRSEKVRDLAGFALVALLASVMLSRCLTGDCPIGHDHPVHLFRIWQLGQTLHHHWFSPWTWSHRWFAGYPENVVYPIGTDLFVLALWALSLGKLSLVATYGLAFWLFYVLYGGAAYYFVRAATQSRVAGLISVVFLLTDPGSNDIGGWFFTVDLGVWTSALGLVPALIAIVQIGKLFDRPSPKTAGVIALCVGLALLCHPLHLVFFAFAVPLLLLSRYITGETVFSARPILFLALAGFIGLLIASYWLVPYLAAASSAAPGIGWTGKTLREIGSALAGSRLFDRMNALAVTLGFVGSIYVLRSRRSLELFMGLFVFAAIAGSSPTFPSFFGPTIATWVEHHIISNRLLMLAKPFWYGAAGSLLVRAWRAFRPKNPEKPASDTGAFPLPWLRPQLVVLLAAVALLLAPLLYFAGADFYHWEIRRPTIWYSDRTDLQARQHFIRWTQKNLAPSHSEEFFRIAHGFDFNDHDLADLAIDLPYPFYEVGPTPTGHFKYAIASSTAAAFHAVNVRFALCHHALKNRPDLRLVKIFQNALWLYECVGWNPKPFEIEGSGPVEVVAFTDEEIILHAGDGAHGRLRLNVCDYPKWRATRDGAHVDIDRVTFPWIGHAALMQVPLSPGTYRFRYTRDFTDYIGTILSMAGIAILLAMLNWRRVEPWSMGWKRETGLRKSEGPPTSDEEAGKEGEIHERPDGDETVPEPVSGPDGEE